MGMYRHKRLAWHMVGAWEVRHTRCRCRHACQPHLQVCNALLPACRQRANVGEVRHERLLLQRRQPRRAHDLQVSIGMFRVRKRAVVAVQLTAWAGDAALLIWCHSGYEQRSSSLVFAPTRRTRLGAYVHCVGGV
jgi:hypothetical protein